MEKLTIELTTEELQDLKEKAEEYDTTVEEILEAFVADLTWSNRSGGSDERLFADEWLRRNICPMDDGDKFMR